MFFKKLLTVTGFESLNSSTSILPFEVIKVIEVTFFEQSIESFLQK
tara:strand:- start:236 stop:373 length:138 start_codon:yes stop_codon:yes gene_type:complete